MSAKQPDIHLPLFGFFQAWRKHGARIGMNEYLALLDALAHEDGFDTDFNENLFQLCRLLWLNPGDSIIQFKRLFRQYYQLEKESIRREKPAEGKAELADQVSASSGDTEGGIYTKGSALERTVKDWIGEDPKDDERIPIDEQAIQSAPGAGEGSHVLDFGAGATGKEVSVRGQQIQEEMVNLVRQQFRFMPQPYPAYSNPRIIRLVLRNLFIASGKQSSDEVAIIPTIEQMARDGGKVLKVIFQQTQTYSARLLVLVDIGPNMVAYHKLTDAFIQLVEKELDESLNILYFSELLNKKLYRNKSRTKLIPLAEVLRNSDWRNIPILIIGDAGAATGKADRSDIRRTEQVIRRLSKLSSRIAWLNPLPEPRWELPNKSDAWYLRERGIAMYDMTHSGIRLAVDILRGMRSVHAK